MPVHLVAIYEDELFKFFKNSFFYYPISLTLSKELPANIISFLV
jgi:hypothetical protein